MINFRKETILFLLKVLVFILPVAFLVVCFAMALTVYLMTGEFLFFGEAFSDTAKEGSGVGHVATFAVSIVTISFGSVGFYLLYLRLENQTKQVENQSRALDHQMAKEVDDRFIAAVGLLGNAEASARTGAIYSLYQLFIDKGGEKYRRQIAQILCSHIRTKTQEPDYQENHKDRPSNEIQTTINLLFKEGKEENGNRGIYCMGEIIEKDNFPRANLEHAFLCGADFWGANCEGANFHGAYCRMIKFVNAHCEGASFGEAHCEGSHFIGAHCEGANFWRSYCIGATFGKAYCQGADFGRAHCEGVIFLSANCAGADFSDACCQGAFLGKADFRGSYALEDRPDYSSAVERIKGQINKETKLENVIFSGELSEESIRAIDEAKPYIREPSYNRLQKIFEGSKGFPSSNAISEDVITGELEDSPELQKIIQKLEELERRKANAPL